MQIAHAGETHTMDSGHVMSDSDMSGHVQASTTAQPLPTASTSQTLLRGAGFVMVAVAVALVVWMIVGRKKAPAIVKAEDSGAAEE